MLKKLFAKESEKKRELTSQQKIVLQQRQQALDMADRAGESLDDKATKLLQASSIVIAIASILITPRIGKLSICSLQFILTVVTFSALFLMILLLVISIGPKRYDIPGTQNWDELNKRYILNDIDETFN